MQIWHKSILLTVLILTPLVLSISLSMDIYVPSLPMIINSFHTTQQALQCTLSIYMFGVGLGQLCFGPITDYLGRRKVVLTGLCFYLFGTLICILAPSILVLVIGRLMQSIGTCAALVIAYAVVRDVFDTKASAKIYSFLNAATALGPVVAPLLGGYLQLTFGTWRASFIFLFGFAMLSFMTTFYFLTETLPVERRLPISIPELRQRYRKIFSVSAFVENTYHSSVGMTVLFVFCCISSYLLIQDLHVSQAQYGLAFASNAITFILANLISTRLSHRISLKFPVRCGLFLIALGSLVMYMMNRLWGLSVWHFMWPMWIITLGTGLMMGPAVAIALEEFPAMAGTASSVINSSQFIFAGFFGTLLMLNTITSTLPFDLMMITLSLLSWLFIVRKPRTE